MSLLTEKSTIAAIVIILSSDHFLIWNSVGKYSYYASLIVFFAIFFKDVISKPIERKNAYIIVAFVFSYILITFPLRPYDVISTKIYIPLFLYFISFSSLHLLEKISNKIAVYVAIVSACSLVVFLFQFLGVTPPYIELSQSFRNNAFDYYKLFGFSVQLSTQSWSFGLGEFVRTSGFMAEPGHFGMFCATLLIAQRMNFSLLRNKFILIGGVLTFSPAFFIFIFASFLIKEEKLTSRIVNLSFLLLFIIILLFVLSHTSDGYLMRRLAGPVLDIASGDLIAVLNSRASEDFYFVYDNINFYQKLWGLGNSYSDLYGAFLGETSSDWRGFVVTNGYVSLFFLLVSILLITFRHITQLSMLCLFLFLEIISHRAGLITSAWFPFLVWVALLRLTAVSDVQEKKNYEEVQRSNA